MAIDLAKYNIRVNAIAPGYVAATPEMLKLFSTQPDMINRIPLTRLWQPEDIVGRAIYLASDASLYITGETIVIDGGLTSSPSFDRA